MALYSTPYNVFLAFTSVDEILKFDIQIKALEKFFLVVLFIMLHNVSLTFEFVHESKSLPFKLKLLRSTFL